MSGHCCENKVFDGVSGRYKRALWIVIAINASMFVVELIAGFSAQSQALQADALDFLADAITYAISLWVIGKSISVRSRAALFKGISLSILGFWVLGSTLYRVFVANHPEPVTMGSIAVLALIANLLSVVILMRYRDGDANVRSVWLCSRNDAIGNVAVIIAANVVWLIGSHWPDLLVAGMLATLFLSSSVQIIRQALKERASHVEYGL